MKKFFALVLALVMAMSLTTVAWGAPTGTGSTNDPWVVANEADLKKAFKDGGNVKLDADITLTNTKTNTFTDEWAFVPVGKTVTLDLAGHSITRNVDDTLGAIRVLGELIVNDSVGNGSISDQGYAVVIGYWKTEGAGAKLTINAGTFTGGSYAISGNGNVPTGNNTTNWSTTITINGGTITGDSVGIYHPQVGTLNITGGTISGATGVEVRGGTLNITGGDISATASSHTSVANGNGATSTGVAVAVAQHTTKQAIDVNISGGELSGVMAFAEENPQANTNPAVTIDVTGGDFDGDVAVTDDQSTAISGGTFSQAVPTEYCATGYVPVIKNGVFTVGTASTPSAGNNFSSSTNAGTTTTVNAVDKYEIYPADSTVKENATVKSYTSMATKTVTKDGVTTKSYIPAYYTVDMVENGVTNIYKAYEADATSGNLRLFKNGQFVTYLNTVGVALNTGGYTEGEYISDTATFVAKGKGCETYSVDVYKLSDGNVYAVNPYGRFVAVLNGKIVAYDSIVTPVPHTFTDEVTYKSRTDLTVVSIKCDKCEKSFTVVKTIPANYIGATTPLYVDGTAYTILLGTASSTVSAGTSTDKTITSAETFDAGIAMYVGMSVMAAAGSAVVIGKKKD